MATATKVIFTMVRPVIFVIIGFYFDVVVECATIQGSRGIQMQLSQSGVHLGQQTGNVGLQFANDGFLLSNSQQQSQSGVQYLGQPFANNNLQVSNSQQQTQQMGNFGQFANISNSQQQSQSVVQQIGNFGQQIANTNLQASNSQQHSQSQSGVQLGQQMGYLQQQIANIFGSVFSVPLQPQTNVHLSQYAGTTTKISPTLGPSSTTAATPSTKGNGHWASHPLYSSNCHDDLPTCLNYGPDICSKYPEWAKQQCAEFCVFCIKFIPVTGAPSLTTHAHSGGIPWNG